MPRDNSVMLKIMNMATDSRKPHAGQWMLRASAALFECVPDISVKEAISIARELHRRHPRMSPEQAVSTFIVPVDEFGLALA
jgi:hypothetical protein